MRVCHCACTHVLTTRSITHGVRRFLRFQLICLAEGAAVPPTALLRLSRLLGCDLRRLLNTLELWCRRRIMLPSGEAPKALFAPEPIASFR